MKKFYSSLFILLVLQFVNFEPLVSQTSLFSVKLTQQSQKQPLSFTLPFTEDWSSASFETNGWVSDCDNWTINNQQGNPGSTAEFTWDPHLQNNYSCALTSDVMNGSQLYVGQIYLDLDIRLDNRNSTGDEVLNVEVFNGTSWDSLISFSNSSSFDWESYHIDITEQARGNNFQIRYRATGQNSFDVLSWFVDNISVYRSCAPPEDLVGWEEWDPTSQSAVRVIAWEAPSILFPAQNIWLHWDSGENSSGIGLTSGGDFSAATRWDIGQITEYVNDTIKKVSIHLSDTSFQDIVLKIWSGENASELIYEDTITSFTDEGWMEIPIDTILLVPENKELWIGYTIIGQVAGLYPAGTDSGPAVAGYGDMITTDGIQWNPLSSFGLDYNWNIQVYLETAKFSDTTSILGFNVYRKVDYEGEYTLLSFVPFNASQSHEYQDFSYYEYVCNKVNSVWESNGDTCISEYALGYEIPMDDFVCISLNGFQNSKQENITVFPNPASTQLSISTKNEIPINEITIYNQLGQKVLHSSQISSSIDVSKLSQGMYIIEVVSDEFRIREKLMIRK